MQVAKINTVACPHCGAPIRIRKYEINVKCEYCGSLYEAEEEDYTADYPKNPNKLQTAGIILDIFSKELEKSRLQESYKREEKVKEIERNFHGMSLKQLFTERIRRILASASTSDLIFLCFICSLIVIALVIGLFEMIFS